MFNHITGNDDIKGYLARMITNRSMGNSLLFAGPDGVGKTLFAEAVAAELLGANSHHHPDYHVYRPLGKIGMHSIDSMRQFSEEVYMAPFSAPWKIFIIQDADRMLSYSANALLKTFEEPSKDSVIILLSSSPESLLPTVLSRCRTVRFHSLAESEVSSLLIKQKNIDPLLAAQIAVRAEGSIGQALQLLEQGGDELRKTLLEILARGKFANYTELMESAKVLSDLVENSKKQEEESIREETARLGYKDLNAAQKEALEKEVEGAVAMRLAHHAHSLFTIILGWYRDMHLLQVNGNQKFLMHQECAQELESQLHLGRLQPLELVQKAIKEATTSIERSTSLNMCFERLFLQLNFL